MSSLAPAVDRPHTRFLKTALAAATATLVTLSGGCARLASPFVDVREAARSEAVAAGFTPARVPAGSFELVVFHRGLGVGGRLHAYVEGDGRAWITKHRLSTDPTPRDPIGLELALRDPHPAVLYLARPCQFLDAPGLGACPRRYWSSHRYGEAVVAAVDAALEWGVAFWRRAGASPPEIGLVGYSGGGTVAALLAARRPDVAWLVTVAANLDHGAWTAHHGVTPLHGSLNPARLAPSRLAGLPQLHLAGGRDRVVPRHVIAPYLRGHHLLPARALRIVPAYSHRCCWPELWPEPLEVLAR